jgi:hypothetical protein
MNSLRQQHIAARDLLAQQQRAGHKTAASLCSPAHDIRRRFTIKMLHVCPQTQGHIKKMQQEKLREIRLF